MAGKDVGFETIAVVGAGSMGSEMTLLFAENNHKISLFDIHEELVKKALESAETEDATKGKVKIFTDYKEFADSLPEKDRLFVFSITHGKPADEVLDGLSPYLKEGDIVVDGGNEWYLNTRRRHDELKKRGIGYIGTGVSGGYQSARRGPSMSPGGDEDVVKKVMPFFQQIAAKDKYTGGHDEPCVRYMGPEGAGHYVKMVHNGIEQGQLSVISEAFELLHVCLGYSDDEIGKIFGEWTADGEMKETYLLEIASNIPTRTTKPKPGEHRQHHLISSIQDKVVQDSDGSEGTGFWMVSETSMRHVAAPTIAAAHYLRIVSSDKAQRERVSKLLNIELADHIGKDEIEKRRKEINTEDIRLAVYNGMLCSYAQGLNLLARTSADEGWNIKLSDCIAIWRAGCIIRCAGLSNQLQPIFEKLEKSDSKEDKEKLSNVLETEFFAKELNRTYASLRKIVSRGVEWGARTSALSASLEYVKAIGGGRLPTAFEEAMLDYFGAHAYDLVSEGAGTVKKGKHHFEWNPA